MKTPTIDTLTARQMADAKAIHEAQIVARPGGWTVMLRTGSVEQLLGTQRTGKARTWVSLDTCVQYLRNELGITKLGLDASGYSATHDDNRRRPDTSERMKRAHQAAAYDTWFRSQVQEALDEPGPGIPHEQIKAKFAARRAALREHMQRQEHT